MSSSHPFRRHKTLTVVAVVLLSTTGSTWARTDEPVRHIDNDPGLIGSLSSLGRGLSRNGRQLLASSRRSLRNLQRRVRTSRRTSRRASVRNGDTWFAAVRDTFSSYQEPSSKRPTFKQQVVPVVTTVGSALLTAYAVYKGVDPFAVGVLATPAAFGGVRLMNLRDQAKRARMHRGQHRSRTALHATRR